MASITVLCPKLDCRAVLRVPDTSRGQRVRCSSCETAFLVPQKKAGVKENVAASTKPQN
jgi:LSD1 subclass zinc finger protein